MSYQHGRLQCDMDKACLEPVSHMDEKGWAYCRPHGLRRKQTMRCRALTPLELRTLRAGRPLSSYSPVKVPCMACTTPGELGVMCRYCGLIVTKAPEALTS